jgi:hypothetical protein
LFSLASLAKTGRLVWSSRVLVAIAALGFLELLPDLPRTRSLTSPKQWPVFKVHNQGMAIRRRAGPGPILTLAPIFVLEGGATIYKEFATGPFAWRASPFVQEEKEARYDLVDAEDLAEFLLPHPPSAILTGNENAALERPLIEYARAHGYRAEMLQERNVLWVKSP